MLFRLWFPLYRLSVRASSALTEVLSVATFTRLGSVVSMAGSGQVGTFFSIFDLKPLGSSLSVSLFTRVGDAVSITDSMILWFAYSVLDVSSLGSTLLVRHAFQVWSVSFT